MSQSKSAVILCETLHWVFHKVRCWAQYFFVCISMTCSNQMRFVHFADNTTVVASVRNINNVHATAKRELVGIDNWLKANILSLNVSKNSYIIISNQKIRIDIRIQYSIPTKVSTVKFLGVTLDENLSFNDHVKKSLLKYLSLLVL